MSRRAPRRASHRSACRSHSLQQLSANTLFLPYATSLRMGRIGYLGKAQEELAVSCNDLESYAA
ncbi:MAG: glutamate--cysteine ligase, partial [Planctomycetota bacterium]